MLSSSTELFEEKSQSKEDDIDFETLLLKHENDVYSALENTLNQSKDWELHHLDLNAECKELDDEIEYLENEIELELKVHDGLVQDIIETERLYSIDKASYEYTLSLKKRYDDMDENIEFLTMNRNFYLDLFQFDFDNQDGIIRINGDPLGVLVDTKEEWKKVDKGWFHLFIILNLLYRFHYSEKKFESRERIYNISIEDSKMYIKTRNDVQDKGQYEFTFDKNDNNRNLERLLKYLKFHFDTVESLVKLKFNEINLASSSFIDKNNSEYEEYSFVRGKASSLKEWNYSVKLMAQNIFSILQHYNFEYLETREKMSK